MAVLNVSPPQAWAKRPSLPRAISIMTSPTQTIRGFCSGIIDVLRLNMAVQPAGGNFPGQAHGSTRRGEAGLEKAECYIITKRIQGAARLGCRTAMDLHDHSEPVSASPSILRLSIWQRLAAGSGRIVLILA